MSADALQVYAGLPILTGRRERRGARAARAPPARLRAVTETFSAGAYADARTRRSTRCSPRAAGRSSSAAPASTCARRSPSWTSPARRPRDPRALGQRRRARLEALHAALAAAPISSGIEPDRPPADRPRARAARGRPRAPAARPRAVELWTADTRHPTLLAALTMEREALYARIDARIDAMLAAGVREEVQKAHDAPARRPRRARRSASRSCCDGDVEAMRVKTRRYAKRQLTWLRKLPNTHHIDMTDRDPGRRRRRAGRQNLTPCASRSGRRWATTTSSSRRSS